MTSGSARTQGVILAGGRGTRVGGRDKGLLEIAGRPLIEHVLARLQPQVDAVTIVANRNRAAYRRYKVPVLADDPPTHAGPLGGIATILRRTRAPYLLIVPCDCPRLPHDLAARLHGARDATGTDIAVAMTDRLQPLFALLRATLLPSLQGYLAGGERAVHGWYAQHRIAYVDFSDCGDAFANLNSPAELAKYELPSPPGRGAGGEGARLQQRWI